MCESRAGTQEKRKSEGRVFQSSLQTVEKCVCDIGGLDPAGPKSPSPCPHPALSHSPTSYVCPPVSVSIDSTFQLHLCFYLSVPLSLCLRVLLPLQPSSLRPCSNFSPCVWYVSPRSLRPSLNLCPSVSDPLSCPICLSLVAGPASPPLL